MKGSGSTRPLSSLLEDGVLELRFQVPDRRNALSTELLRQLVSDVESTGAEAIVIGGSSECFSAGADLAEIEGSPRDNRFDDEVAAAVAALRATPAVVFAAIEGPCIGAAFDLASACDLRVASETAFFAVPAVRLGLLYSPAAVDGMVRRLGRSAILRLLLLGERLDAEEAQRLGAVDRFVAAGTAREVALELAKSAADPELREVRAGTKRLIDEVGHSGFDAAVWQELRNRLAASRVRQGAVQRAKSKR